MTHDDIPDLLVAQVAEEWIAFPARRIERVLPAIPPFGEFPSFATARAESALFRRLLGLATLDGRVLTLVDPAALLGKSACASTEARTNPKKTLVVDSGPYQFGLVVDAVIGIRTGRKDEGTGEESGSSPGGAKSGDSKSDPGLARSQASVFMDIHIDSKRARLIDIDILCSSMLREAA